jgi:hypothetical protein
MNQSVRTASLVAALVVGSAVTAAAQGSRGVARMGASPPPQSPHTPPPPPPSSDRGRMLVPRAPQGPTGPRGGDVPRVVTRQGSTGYIRGTRLGSGYSRGSTYYNGSSVSGGSSFGGAGFDGFGHRFEPGSSHRWQPGYTRVVGGGCFGSCFRIGVGGRPRFFGSFFFGYPFYFPVAVPYFYSTYETVVQPVAVAQPYAPGAEPYVPFEEQRAASKLIVVGGGTGNGGDALTVETRGDSVYLSWLSSGRQAREVKLFVADSAQHQLATRSASPSAPNAMFEVSTLSAPVAFAGVTVTFADGVTTTTTVPYRASSSLRKPR